MFSCVSHKKYIETIEKPSLPTKDSRGLIKYNDGQENAKRMKYYNSLQHKRYYKIKF